MPSTLHTLNRHRTSLEVFIQHLPSASKKEIEITPISALQFSYVGAPSQLVFARAIIDLVAKTVAETRERSTLKVCAKCTQAGVNALCCEEA
jgi:hypothetical protein